MSEKLSSAKPTSMRTNIAFALSELACNPLYTIMIAVLVYFYTDVVGMDPAIVGTIILVSKVFDGISDIIAGNIIDHTHTKAGSARPWYLRMAIPMALSYIMLFIVPNWSTGGKVAYIFVSYNVVSTVVYTLTNAAMASFPTFLTKHRESRSVMSTFRLFVACGTQMLLLIIIFPFVEMLGGGQGGWIKMAVILGTFAAVVLTFVYFNTKEESAGDEKEANDVPLMTAIKSLLQNKYWFLVLGLYFIVTLFQVTTMNVGVYYAKYVLMDVNLSANLNTYFLLPNLVILAMLPFFFNKGFSKQKLCIFGAVLLIVGSVIGVVFPAGMGFITGIVLRGFGFAFQMGCMTAMVIETVVYGEWKTGYNIPGVTLTANCVAQKIGGGVGTAVVGFALTACGYDGLAKVQSASAISAINFIYLILPGILSIVLLFGLFFYKLDADYPKYVKDLEERHAQKGKA